MKQEESNDAEGGDNKIVFWVCAFSIYQSNDEEDGPTISEQLGPDPEFGPFATVLKGADSMVAVVTKICDIYTRLWYVH